MKQKYGLGGMLILAGTALFIVSLFMPWTSVLSFNVNGFIQEGYYILLLFLYPIYTVQFHKKMKPFLGLLSSVFALVFLIYYLTNMSQTYMGTAYSAAGIGLYVAILSTLILLVGVVFKTKKLK